MLLPPLCPFVAPARNLPDLSTLMPASPLASHGWRDRRGNPFRSNTCKSPTNQNDSTALESALSRKGAGPLFRKVSIRRTRHKTVHTGHPQCLCISNPFIHLRTVSVTPGGALTGQPRKPGFRSLRAGRETVPPLPWPARPTCSGAPRSAELRGRTGSRRKAILAPSPGTLRSTGRF
jgi:hypothetical protein